MKHQCFKNCTYLQTEISNETGFTVYKCYAKDEWFYPDTLDESKLPGYGLKIPPLLMPYKNCPKYDDGGAEVYVMNYIINGKHSAVRYSQKLYQLTNGRDLNGKLHNSEHR